jgi:hypothetical protein
MAYSRWNWLLFPVSLVLVYALMTWYLWVPLSRAEVVNKSGSVFVRYWEGEVVGFAAIRLVVAGPLSLFCFAFVPRLRWEPALTGLTGALTGLIISVLDRYLFNWANYHIGYLEALFLTPLGAGLLVMLPVDWALRRRTQAISNQAAKLTIAVGTAIAGCPPHRPGRALISASGSYLG